MATRDASTPQLDFPQLVADLITTLQLTGQLGVLNMGDTVIPTISVGNVRPVTAVFLPVTFASAEILSATFDNPAGGQVIGDTGVLAAGTYDIWAHISTSGLVSAGAAGPVTLEHRNAANNATLATLLSNSKRGSSHEQFSHLDVIGYVIGLNERLRFIFTGGTTSMFVATELGFAIRPTP